MADLTDEEILNPGLPYFGHLCAFAASEYSDENTSFLQVCHSNKASLDQDACPETFANIANKFVAKGSTQEINLPTDLQSKFMGEQTGENINKLINAIRNLVERDTLPRFKRSDMYKVMITKIGPKKKQNDSFVKRVMNVFHS